MKILFIYKSYYPESRGGVEECLRVLMAGLTQKGYQCTLLVTTQKKKGYSREEGGVIIHYCPANMTFASCPISLSFLQKFHQLSRSHDIINFHFPWPFADLAAFCVRPNKPYVITYQSDIVKQKYLKIFYSPLMHWFLRHANVIVATSEPYRQSSLILRSYPNQTQVIPLGLSEGLAIQQFSDKLPFWRTKVGDNFFLFLGVLRYYKGLIYLLEAVENTTIPIVIAGSGPEEAALKALAQRKKLNNVLFVGAIDEEDKAALLALCKALVIPASERSEAYCLSLVEGLRAAKPLISTELGTGTSFVNQANVTGLVVPAKDAQALHKALLQLNQENKICAKFAEAARRRYVDYFQSEDMIIAYEKMLMNMQKAN
jgi:rhamnosyl/mannosyltransferase